MPLLDIICAHVWSAKGARTLDSDIKQNIVAGPCRGKKPHGRTLNTMSFKWGYNVQVDTVHSSLPIQFALRAHNEGERNDQSKILGGDPP